MTDINTVKSKLAGLEDYGVENKIRRIKSPLSSKVPFGKEDRKLKQIRSDTLDKATEEGLAGMKDMPKVRPPKPTQADRRRMISAKMDEARLKIQQLKLARDERIISHEHKHSIVFKGAKIGAYRAASLEEQSGKYAKYWLLNAKQTNGNGWGIAQHTAAENMKKFIGRPLVVTAQSWHGASEYGDSYEHPYLPTNDMNQIFSHQDKFKVGSIVDVYEDKNNDWYANIEMLPKFAMKSLPPFCSPAIYQLDAREAEGNISKWEALHLAALNENPAYGARIALLKGTCIGTANSCKIQFKSAKQLSAGRFDPPTPSPHYNSDNDEDDLAESNKIHYNDGEKDRIKKLDKYIDNSPNKKGRRVNEQQYNKYVVDNEGTANREYTRNNKPINPSNYPQGKKITPQLKRQFAKLQQKLSGLENSQGRIKASDDLKEHIKNSPKSSREESFNHLFHKKHTVSNITYALNNHYGEERREATDEDRVTQREHNDRRFREDIDNHVLRSSKQAVNKKKIIPPDDDDEYDRMRDRREYTTDDRGVRRIGQVVCPKKLKERLANIFDERAANPGMKIKDTKQVFNDGGGTEEDVGLVYGEKTLKRKREELKKRIASLGEENMTYQDSKPVKVKKNEIKSTIAERRKALIPTERVDPKESQIQFRNMLIKSTNDSNTQFRNFLRKASEEHTADSVLRSMGRSVDASHAQSIWLSQNGDFIGGRNTITHAQQVSNITRLPSVPQDSDKLVTEFSAEHGLPRVQVFPINRAGDKKVSIGIHSKINSSQLKSIQDLEKEGHVIGFGVGPTIDKIIQGDGFNNMVKALRENKFL